MFENFLSVCKDVTKTTRKIPQGEYLSDGTYKIFDQGKNYIGGYCNTANGVASDYPYIVFGDHTRVIKYINEPCYIGADGVKLLKVYNNDFIPKFVYYAMLANPVEHQGYSRHFKLLKETKIRKYDKSIQNTIIDELDKINLAISLKESILNHLDELVKSRFIEMFGTLDLSIQGESWLPLSEISTIYTGTTPSTKEKENWDGKIPWITPAELSEDSFFVFDSERKITEKGLKSKSLSLMPKNTVLLSTRAPIGKVAIAGIEMCCNQGFKNFHCNNTILNPIYLYTLLKNNNEYLNSLGTGTTFKEISKTNVSKIKVPVANISLQNEFAEYVKLIDKSKFIVQKQIDDLQELLDSKMDEYFG